MISYLTDLIQAHQGARIILAITLTLATLLMVFGIDYLRTLPLWAGIFMFPYILVGTVYEHWWGSADYLFSSTLNRLLAPAITWYVTVSLIFMFYEAVRKKPSKEK